MITPVIPMFTRDQLVHMVPLEGRCRAWVESGSMAIVAGDVELLEGLLTLPRGNMLAGNPQALSQLLSTAAAALMNTKEPKAYGFNPGIPSENRLHIIGLLIRHGALWDNSLSRTWADRARPFCEPIMKLQEEGLRTLLKVGLDLGVGVRRSNIAPIHAAVEEGDLALAVLLYRVGAATTNQNGANPCETFVQGGGHLLATPPNTSGSPEVHPVTSFMENIPWQWWMQPNMHNTTPMDILLSQLKAYAWSNFQVKLEKFLMQAEFDEARSGAPLPSSPSRPRV